MRSLINDNVLDLPPYRPGALPPEFTDRAWVRLSANENPNPLPASLATVFREFTDECVRYPDSSSLLLRQALASRHGVDPQQVIVGAGSTELIGMIVSAFLKGAEKVLTSESTFLMYKLATIERAGLGALLETPLRDDFAIDLEAMERHLHERVKLIFIASPNNPTGLRLTGKELDEFAAKLSRNTLLVLDNAYQEYVDDVAGDEGMDLMKKRDNVIVLRTFSKIFGLAGLRIGYAVASARLVDYLNRVKPPFNVSGLAQKAAMVMLKEGEFLKDSQEKNRQERQRILQGMRSLGLSVLPSQANFLLFMPSEDSGRLCQRFKQKGVLLRPGSPFGLPGAIRVSIGTRDENDRFLHTLSELMHSETQP